MPASIKKRILTQLLLGKCRNIFNSLVTGSTRLGFILFFVFCSNVAIARLSHFHYFPPLKEQSASNLTIVQQQFYLSTPDTTSFNLNVYRGASTSLTTFPSEALDTDGDREGDNRDEDDATDGHSDEMGQAEGTNTKNANEYPEDTDNVCIPDYKDGDDDNDGIADGMDVFPMVASASLLPAQAFTPNVDGNNNTWMVPGMDNYPNNQVRVCNRWGYEVYAASGYANDWEGIYRQNREKLPACSYMYVVELGNGSAPLSGWLFIN